MIFDLKNAVRDPIQKVSVVRNDHDRPLVAGQILLQPLKRTDVQMVGRLVEKQKIRFFEQQSRQRETRTLTAGQRADLLIVKLRGESHGMQNTGDLRFIGVAALLLVGQMQAVELFHLRRAAAAGFDFGAHLLNLRFEIVNFAEDLVDFTDNGSFAVKIVSLLQIPYARVL